MSDHQEPSFLRKLKGDYNNQSEASHSLRNSQSLKYRQSKSTPDEDEPVIVDEQTNEIITKASLDSNPGKVETAKCRDDLEITIAERNDHKKSKHELDQGKLSRANLFLIGSLSSKRKRTAPMIVSPDADEAELESSSRVSSGKGRKKPRKKAMTLSFEE